MTNKIVLISDDSNFFDYLRCKLELRKSDELFVFNFDDIPDKIHLLETSVLIVNSENAKEKTLELLSIFKSTPIIVMAYNDDDNFKKKCYRAGMLDFMSLLTPDAEFRTRILPALSLAGLLEKNKQYRNILVKNNILTDNNEVFLNYESVIEKELEEINKRKAKAVFIAISPSDKTKLKITPNTIETIILNNIRKNDILMNYAPNKYFLILLNIDLSNAEKLWQKISNNMPYKIYAVLTNITNQKKEQLINESLNKLHQAINLDKTVVNNKAEILNPTNNTRYNINPYNNFKIFRQEFEKKIEQVISPVFYQMQQKYSGKFNGITLEQNSGEGYGSFFIKGKYSSSSFKISCPGFSKINIDITSQKGQQNIDTKRISLEPEELEVGLLQDLLEQFIIEYKREAENDS
ncbi:MAG: hypothetical protein E7Z92_07140 [Cyanobacteria bacterium SIG31]|nr:hypothetical protein [Cyanobacteria bacterium SIG31]